MDLSLTALLLAALATLSACSSTQYSIISGKPSGDVSGDDEFPILFLAVNGTSVSRNTIRARQGAFLLSGAPINPWVRGIVHKRSWHVTVEPCTRYFYIAKFEDPKAPTWKPVLKYREEIPGCMDKFQAAENNR